MSNAHGISPLTANTPLLPGMTALSGSLKTYAPSPVWRDSTTADVKFAPLSKKKAAKLWHEARRFERETRKPGHQDGALGRNGLAVLYALLFDFLNFTSGRLDPAIATIARAASISERSAARGLTKLKQWRVLNWVRRCEVEIGAFGRAVFKQLSNAYAVLPVSQWLGHKAAPEAPAPQSGTWGDHPALPSVIEQAASETSLTDKIKALALDPADGLAAALAALGGALKARETEVFTGLPA